MRAAGLFLSVVLLAAVHVSADPVHIDKQSNVKSPQMVTRIAKSGNFKWENNLCSTFAGLADPVACAVVYRDTLILAGSLRAHESGIPQGLSAWNGNNLSPFGPPIRGYVEQLAVCNDSLFAAGELNFSGQSRYQIVVLAGTDWEQLTDFPANSVAALCSYDDRLIVGGSFDSLNGVASNNVAIKSGSTWLPAGSGTNGPVTDLIVFNGLLIAAGDFTVAGGVLARHIAAWNGSDWAPLGEGIAGTILSLEVSGGKLIVGGDFDSAGTTSAYHLASWDGQTWEQVGSGLVNPAKLLASRGGELIVSTTFPCNGCGGNNGIVYQLVDTGLVELGRVSANSIRFLESYRDLLVLGGELTTIGGIGVKSVAAWDGAQWSSLSEGINGPVTSLAVYDDLLIAAGPFSTIGARVQASGIAAWDGTQWHELPGGPTGSITALTLFDDNLFIGGAFKLPLETEWGSVAFWNGSAWAQIAPDDFGVVSAFAAFEGNLVAVGSALVRSWNGTTWTDLGGRVYDDIYAAQSFQNNLYIAGNFASSTSDARYLGVWDGLDWASITPPLESYIFALAEYNNNLIVGGMLNLGLHQQKYGLLSRTGSDWTPIGDQALYGMMTLALYDSCLIIGGEFYEQDSLPGGCITSWDGTSFHPLGSGLNNVPAAMCEYQEDLIVAGYFTEAGGISSPYLARWTDQQSTANEDEPLTELPNDVLLGQNYPNPFNPSTTMEYSLPVAGDVSLQVVNLLGQTVKTLVGEWQPAGSYRISWDGTNESGAAVASGVYFYRLVAGDIKQSRKMILAR